MSLSCALVPSCLRLAVLLVLASALCTTVVAYIPAMASNDSDLVLDSANASSLQLAWFGGGFSEPVSYQLVGADSDGVNKVRRVSVH
jgi:hypothetical protein